MRHLREPDNIDYLMIIGVEGSGQWLRVPQDTVLFDMADPCAPPRFFKPGSPVTALRRVKMTVLHLPVPDIHGRDQAVMRVAVPADGTWDVDRAVEELRRLKNLRER